jgi:hypothetical protein
MEVVSAGTIFEASIHLRNFEIWQLGMLFTVIQDMQDGLITLGSGRSRGLGKVTAALSEQGLILSTIRGSQEPEEELWGLGRWLNGSANGSEQYGTRADDYLSLDRPVAPVNHAIRRQRTFTGQDLEALQAVTIERFVKSMQEWPTKAVALESALPQQR